MGDFHMHQSSRTAASDPQQSETTRLLSQNLKIARDNESTGMLYLHTLCYLLLLTVTLLYLLYFSCLLAANAIIDELNSQGEMLITTESQVI